MERYEREEKIAANKVQELTAQLEAAKKAVTEAQEYVNKVRSMPPTPVPDDAELRRRANKEITAAQKSTFLVFVFPTKPPPPTRYDPGYTNSARLTDK
jgi:hypothetical protein